MGWFLKNALNAEFWIKVKQQALVWHVGVFPGLAVVSCVVIARLSGSFQVLEWNAFDNFLRLRPNETEDTRVVIVGIVDTPTPIRRGILKRSKSLKA